MSHALRSPLLSFGLAAWLLLTNLVLGVYHRHDADDSAPLPGAGLLAAEQDADPGGWHYHLLLLGVEFSFLSMDADTCPFAPEAPAQQEAHTLLSGVLGAGGKAESSPDLALLRLADVSLAHVSIAFATAGKMPCPLVLPAIDAASPPLADIARGCRTGVQQV
jgi:hypothetical protein